MPNAGCYCSCTRILINKTTNPPRAKSYPWGEACEVIPTGSVSVVIFYSFHPDVYLNTWKPGNEQPSHVTSILCDPGDTYTINVRKDRKKCLASSCQPNSRPALCIKSVAW